MIVYVVEKGEYSSRHIVGVTLNPETAARLEKLADSEYERAFTTEYETDVYDDKRQKFIVEDIDGEWDAELDTRGRFGYIKENTTLWGEYMVFAESKEQAIKIAQDMKAQKLAEKNGVC